MQIIKSLNWILSYGCNCRCSHCDIWNSKEDLDINLDNLSKVINTPLLQESYRKLGSDFNIALGGGEPFLSTQFAKAVEMIENAFPAALKCISTNGVLTERIVCFSQRFKDIDFKFNISVDGIGKIHDAMRGLKGCFSKVMETVVRLKKATPLRRIELKLTLVPGNFDQIIPVYELSKKMGCGFSFKPAENIKSYTNRFRDLKYSFDPKELCVIRNQSFKVADQMRMMGNYKQAAFFKDIPFYLTGNKKQGACLVPNENLTLMPDGSMYGCLFMPKLGNIRSSNQDFLGGEKSLKECPTCMLMCGYYKQYKNELNKPKVANIEVTHNCNLNCKMCTQGKLRQSSNVNMGLRKFSEIINKHKEITHVSILGGEPFLNKDLFVILAFLDRVNLTYEITTNATLLNRASIKKIRTLVGLKQLNISLDGLKKYHDLERGRGVYDKCMQAIKSLGGYTNLCVCSVLKNDNFHQIVKLNALLPSIVNQHKVIYCVSFDEDILEKSRRIFPGLAIQGPAAGFNLLDHKLLEKTIQALSKKKARKTPELVFEPAFVRYRVKEFLADNKISASCKQLDGYRFDPSGRRIICEFIRNAFDQESVNRIKSGLLPICRQCCKLEIK